MKRNFTLRTQLTFLMAVLVLLQSFALVASLNISRVFFMLDAESYRLFESTMSSRTQSFDSNIGMLVGNVAQEANRLSQSLTALASERGVSPAELYADNENYLAAASAGAETVIDLLKGNSITGAFFMLDSSNSNPDDPYAHSGVYISSSAPGSTASGTMNYIMEVGPIAISQEWHIATSVGWRLDISTAGDDRAAALYSKPQSAAREFPGSEMERYGYWSPPRSVLDGNQQAIYYTMPLVDKNGEPFGVIGIEISLAHLTQYYLPNTDLPYKNSFYAITTVDGDRLTQNWVIPSGPLAAVYLRPGEEILLRPVEGASLFEATIPSLGAVYCAAQPLTIYSRNSPYFDEGWNLVGFAPQSAMHETSGSVQSLLQTSILATTLLALVSILVMVFVSTRKISGLSKYLSGLSPSQDIRFPRTGMREIDDLTEVLARLNQSVRKAEKTTSKMLELTLLPIGGFEVSEKSSTVTVTEYVYKLLELDPKTVLTAEMWRKEFEKLTAIPAKGYENIYKFFRDENEEPKWLRILSAPSEDGEVGVILDVTRDVEEQRRLSHELDYDALTRLYNRIAFKREANSMIMKSPKKVGAMIFSDLDNLKKINDTYGHETGDKLIVTAANVFRRFEKLGGIAARISGDEFAIYLHGFSSINEGREIIMGHFRENSGVEIEAPDGTVHPICFSTGIAWYPKDSVDVTDLLKLSDYAMYEAKHNHKGEIEEYNLKPYDD